MSQTPQELIHLCLLRDTSAWEEFVRRYANLIYWAIRRTFTRSRLDFQREELEDTFQQLFLHLWEKGLREARGVERLEGWLVLVAHRLALDVLKQKKRRPRTVSFEAPTKGEEGGALLGELLPDETENPRQTTEEKLLEEMLEAALGQLSKKEALILRLHLLEEKTHAEISELLKIPPGSVSSVIQRAKRKIAPFLKGQLGKP